LVTGDGASTTMYLQAQGSMELPNVNSMVEDIVCSHVKA